MTKKEPTAAPKTVPMSVPSMLEEEELDESAEPMDGVLPVVVEMAGEALDKEGEAAEVPAVGG